MIRDHFVYAPSQWEMMLHCNKMIPVWLDKCIHHQPSTWTPVWIGHVTRQPFAGLLSWYPLRYCWSFEDWVPIDFIYKYLSFTWVAVMPYCFKKCQHDRCKWYATHLMNTNLKQANNCRNFQMEKNDNICHRIWVQNNEYNVQLQHIKDYIVKLLCTGASSF